MEWVTLFFLLVLIFAILYLAVGYVRKRRKPHIEFKCLEHMVPLSLWNAEDFCWQCPTDGCEVWVDAEVRWQYEGIRPPK